MTRPGQYDRSSPSEQPVSGNEVGLGKVFHTDKGQVGGNMRNRHAWMFLAVGIAPLCNAQWAQYRDPATPRTRDGKPNMSAPAPRLNGKPDLTGIWEAESAPLAE